MNTTPATHPDEGALIRMLDDALELDESASVQRHVAQCESCRERLDELRILARGWTRVLEEGDAHLEDASARTVLRQAHDRRWLLRAAILILAAGIVAVPPVRAGIAQLWQRITGPVVPATAVTGVDAATDAFALSFPFEDTSFVLAFDAPQPAGTVLITFGGEGTNVTARIESGQGAELLVRPEGLHVRNDTSATATYRIDLPARVREVRVEVAGEAARRLRAGGAVRMQLPLQR